MITQNDMHEANVTLRALCLEFASLRGYALRDADTDSPTIVGPRFAWTLWLEDDMSDMGIALKGVSRPASEGRAGRAVARALLLDRTRTIARSGSVVAMETSFHSGLFGLSFGE